MLTLVTAPALPVVTLAEAKSQLRVEASDEDAYIQGLVETATQRLDGADGFLGRALNPQTWDWEIANGSSDGGLHWGDEPHGWRARYHHLSGYSVPLPPLISVDSVKYVDPAGVTQALDPSLYIVRGAGSSSGGFLDRAYQARWPAMLIDPSHGGMTIRFTAGYPLGDSDAVTVPAPIKQAILLTVSRLYEQRENPPADLGGAVEALLAPYRVWGR